MGQASTGCLPLMDGCDGTWLVISGQLDGGFGWIFCIIDSLLWKTWDGIEREAGNEMGLVTLECGVKSRTTVHREPEAEEAFGDSISSKATTYMTH